MAYKRILTIQDISCVGQCSMTVALPVLSACGHETCILPTALLSTHTGGFGKPVSVHFDDALTDIRQHWQKCEISFDAILVGYLGSIGAVHTVIEIAGTLLAPGGVLIVDPAMADNGKFYAGFGTEYAREIKKLCDKADIILPNVTEAAILTNSDYHKKYDDCYVNMLTDKLNHPCIVMTGVGFSESQTGVFLQEGTEVQYYQQRQIGGSFHGTGDLFAACFTGALMQGHIPYEAVKIAADFTKKCIENTIKCPAHWYGIKFEPLLPELIQMIQA